jgi:hypothetical protein
LPDRDRVEALVAMVEAGRYDEAIEQFYHPHASMQENQAEPRVGRDGLVAGERKVMGRYKTMVTHPVDVMLVDGDRSLIRWRFEFTPAEGPPMKLEELALQRWEGDRIAEEQFYYDPAQTRPGG